jgi:hypothetical protein
MYFDDFELGSGALADRFLAEAGATGQRLKSLFLVSPFVELASRGELAQRITRVLLHAKLQSDDVALISDNTGCRRGDFGIAVAIEPDLEGVLYLHPKLHAKAGLATLQSGYQFGFVGSANLTTEGLFRNRELVIGLVNNSSGQRGSRFCSDLEDWIRATLSTSTLATSSLKLLQNS